MIKLNPIRQIVQKIEEKLYLEIPVSAAELLGIHEGDIVQFLPEKVSYSETISEKTGPSKLDIPIVDPNDIRGFSERLRPSKVKELFLQKISKYGIRKIKGKNSVYDIGSRCRIYIKYSKYLTQNPASPYFFGLDPDVIQEFNNDANKRFFIVFIAENENNVYIFPWEDFEGWLIGVSPASKDNNFKMTYTPDLKLRLTGKEPIDISRYLNNFELIEITLLKETQTPIIQVKQKGSHQVLEVIEEMLNGIKYGDACKNIAGKHGVQESTIREACTRRLGISTNEFVDIVDSPDKRGDLVNKLKR